MIQTKNDALNEAGETLTVTLDTATSAGDVDVSDSSDDATASTTISPPDTVIVSIDDVSVVEGNSAVFMVTLSEALSEDVKVGYSTPNGTAMHDSTSPDYVAAGSTAALVIAAGKTAGAITIETLEDTIAEADETFTVILSLDTQQPDNVKRGIATGTATIVDDTLAVTMTGRQRSPRAKPRSIR